MNRQGSSQQQQNQPFNDNTEGSFSFFNSIFNPAMGLFNAAAQCTQQVLQPNQSSSQSSSHSYSQSSQPFPTNVWPFNYQPMPQQGQQQQQHQQQHSQSRTQNQQSSSNNNQQTFSQPQSRQHQQQSQQQRSYPHFGNSSSSYSSSSSSMNNQNRRGNYSSSSSNNNNSNNNNNSSSSQSSSSRSSQNINHQPQQQQQPPRSQVPPQQQPQQPPRPQMQQQQPPQQQYPPQGSRRMEEEEEVRPTFMSTRNGWRKSEKEEQQKKEKKKDTKEDTSDFWKQKGTDLAKRGYTDSAIECYTKAISIDPSQSIYYSNRGRCYKNKGDFKRAFDDAVQAMELDDKNLKGHLLCGQVLCEMGKEETGYLKIENGIKKLTKGLTLCVSQAKSKKKMFEKDIGMYIFRAKKLLWYKKYQEQRDKKEKLISNYKVYLEQLPSITDDERQIQMDDFIFTVGDPFKEFDFTIPDHLQCKITLDLIEDPVTTEAGHTYEREVIEDHFKKNGPIDPLTREPVKPVLYPNLSVKQGVQEFLEKNPWAYEYSYNEDYKKIEF